MRNYFKRSKASAVHSATKNSIDPFAIKDSKRCIMDANEAEDDSFHHHGASRAELNQLKFWISSLIESEQAVLQQAEKSLGFKIDDSLSTESCSPSYLQKVRAFKKKKAKADYIIASLQEVLDEIKASNKEAPYEDRVADIVALQV
jgi:hypothetical protein